MNIEDKTYENETKLTPKDDRGDLDLTKQIDEKDKRIILLETKLKKMVQRNLALYSHIKNVQDIILTINIILGAPPSYYELCSGDINEDGVIDILDIVLLINLIRQ